MPSDEIADDLREFIVKQIESITHLEALLLLRENPQQEWTDDFTAKRLYISEAEAARVLENLQQNGFLTTSGTGYQFGCETPELEEIVTRLAELYRQKLIPVTNLIHSKQNRIQEFADAFKLRKDS